MSYAAGYLSGYAPAPPDGQEQWDLTFGDTPITTSWVAGQPLTAFTSSAPTRETP